MPAINPADLRGRPIGRDWRFYVFQPAILWIGAVGGAPTQGDRQLEVTTIIGNPADIEADMTVHVFTAGGAARDPGKVRFKSHTPGVPDILEVAENAVEWANGDLVQAWRLFEIWPRIPYINGAGVQFKDRDIAWANDNQAQPPKANAGPAAIVDLPAGGTVDIVFQDEGSFDCPAGAAIGTWLWAPIGGAPAVVAGGLNQVSVTLRYDTAGYYYVRLTVTDGNGITGHVYVPVIIDDGTYRRRNVLAVDRAWDSYGWRLSRRIVGLATTAYDNTWYDGAPCFLVADAGGVATAAFADNRSTLRWSGWLVEDDTQRHEYGRSISFKAVSSAHLLANIPAFPTGLRSDAAPADWYEFTQLNVDSVAYLLLNWHSTVCQVADYHPTGEWVTRLRPGENCDADDILTQVYRVLAACKGDLRCDRQGILRAMRHEWFLSAAEEAARATVMTLADQDLRQASYGPHLHQARFREARLSGVDGAGNPYLAGAPGPSPLDGGKPVEVQRLAPLNQAELTRWAGQELALRNYAGVVTLRMSGEYDAVDPALGEYVAGTLGTFDTRIPDGPYSVIGVRFADDHLKGVTLGEWQLLPAPGEYEASTRPIPEIPPPPPPPPLPPDDYPEPEPEVGTGEVWVIGTLVGGIVYTTDMISGNPPTFTQMNTGLANLDIRWGPVGDNKNPSTHLACIDGTGEIYINTNWRAGGSWLLGLSIAEATAVLVPAEYTSINGLEICQVYAHAAEDDETATLFTVIEVDVTGLAGDRETRVLYSLDWGSTWQIMPVVPGQYYASGWWNYLSTVFFEFDYKRATSGASQTVGSLAFLNDSPSGQANVIFGARAGFGALERGNITHGGWDGWAGIAYERCPAGGGVPPDGTPNNISGMFGVPDRHGPGPICVSATGSIYLSRWREHECAAPVGANTYMATAKSLNELGFRISEMGTLILPNEFACRPDMLFSTPSYLVAWVALDVTAGNTEVYINSLGASAATISVPCMGGWSYPVIVDDEVIMLLGRGYTAATRAGAPDPELLYLSVNSGVGWIEKGASMFTDYGVTGIIGAFADPSRD